MIPYIEINTESPVNFYSEFELTDEDLSWFKEQFYDGDEQDSLDIFMEDYLLPSTNKFQETMITYLFESDLGPMRIKEQDKLSRNITLLSIGLSTLLINNFRAYLTQIYSDKFFNEAGIKESSLKKAIISETMSEFERIIGGSLSQTQTFILGSIKTLQREMIAENLYIKNSGLAGEELEKEILRFRESLRIKYPNIYSAMKKGNILMTQKFINGEEITRHYKLDYYIDLVSRTSLLNVDRTTNIISATVNEEKVLEFYLSDPRAVKKDREICQEILHTKILGKSILALREDVATKLGIMSVDMAKNTPDYSFGPMCRHSLKRCESSYLKEIDRLLEI